MLPPAYVENLLTFFISISFSACPNTNAPPQIAVSPPTAHGANTADAPPVKTTVAPYAASAVTAATIVRPPMTFPTRAPQSNAESSSAISSGASRNGRYLMNSHPHNTPDLDSPSNAKFMVKPLSLPPVGGLLRVPFGAMSFCLSLLPASLLYMLISSGVCACILDARILIVPAAVIFMFPAPLKEILS